MRTYHEVEQLVHGNSYNVCLYRLPQTEREDAIFVKPPFTNERLYVQRDRRGKVCLVTPMDRGWAEFDPRCDYQRRGNIGIFIAEDFAMEIDLGGSGE